MYSIELKKIRKATVFPIIVGFEVLSVVIGTVLFLQVRQDFAKQGVYWLGLWGQSAFYYAQIFFPILISILVSLVCRAEHLNKNWQRLKALPVRPSQIIMDKLLFLMFLTFISELLFLGLFSISGWILNLPMANFTLYSLGVVYGWIGSVAIISIQLFLSIKFESFTTPILIATGGAIAGIVSLFINEHLMNVFPYAQITIGMRARSLTLFSGNQAIAFIIVNLLFGGLGFLLSIRQLVKLNQ
jgi:ABC-2 type transport system permease protein